MSSWGNDLSACMVLASNTDHSACRCLQTAPGDAEALLESQTLKVSIYV